MCTANDTSSASDGGFYKFEGCLAASGDHYRVGLSLVNANYFEQGDALKKVITLEPRGTNITVDGRLYRRNANPHTW